MKLRVDGAVPPQRRRATDEPRGLEMLSRRSNFNPDDGEEEMDTPPLNETQTVVPPKFQMVNRRPVRLNPDPVEFRRAEFVRRLR